MTKYFKLLFLGIVLLMGINVIAQKNKPLRIEIEAKNNSGNFSVIPLGKNGLVTYFDTGEKTADNDRIWEMRKYDIHFTQQWKKNIIVNNYLGFKSCLADQDNIYLFFAQNTIDPGAGKGYYEIFSINSNTSDIKKITGNLPKRTNIYSFKVKNNMAYLAGLEHSPGYLNVVEALLTIAIIPHVAGQALPV